MKTIILFLLLISTNLHGQKIFSFSLTEGYHQYDKFSDYNFTGAEFFYGAHTLQSELALSYSVFESQRTQLKFGIGIAHSYYFNSGQFFPIDGKSNSIFSRINSRLALGRTHFHVEGNYSLYYVPPLFRRYYSQKRWFQIIDLGIGYKFKNNLSFTVIALSSLNSPFYSERLSYIIGFTDIPKVEITGFALRLSKPIF